MDIPHTELDCFEQKYSDQVDLLCEVLKYWLKTAVKPRPSWEAVVTALRSRIVNEKNIAAQLESKYCAQAQCTADDSNTRSMVEEGEGIAITSNLGASPCMWFQGFLTQGKTNYPTCICSD